MTSETPNLHVSKNLNISKTKKYIEKLKTPLRLVWKCCSDAFQIGSTIFRHRGTLNAKKLNRIDPIRISLIALDLEYVDYVLSCSKIPLEFGCNFAFHTNIDNGLWDVIATITMQCRNPESFRLHDEQSVCRKKYSL